jgi:hypothetical protein
MRRERAIATVGLWQVAEYSRLPANTRNEYSSMTSNDAGVAYLSSIG